MASAIMHSTDAREACLNKEKPLMAFVPGVLRSLRTADTERYTRRGNGQVY